VVNRHRNQGSCSCPLPFALWTVDYCKIQEARGQLQWQWQLLVAARWARNVPRRGQSQLQRQRPAASGWQLAVAVAVAYAGFWVADGDRACVLSRACVYGSQSGSVCAK
jgi:hypothetical protein